jgi:hypothetical protein
LALNIHVSEVARTCTKLVMLGDFNYPEVNCDIFASSRGTDHASSKFVDTCADSLLDQLVIHPTRISRGAKTNER